MALAVALLAASVVSVDARRVWDKGFNFRSDPFFCTDGADTTYVTAADAYPTTRNGVTFGWTAGSAATVDRSTGLQDCRFGGIAYGNGGDEVFRVDLTGTGNYDIRVAQGDYTASQSTNQITYYDNSTLVLDVGPHNTSADEYYDASNTIRVGTAAWIANNVASNESFATTTFLMKFPRVGDYSVITHLFISQASAPPSTPCLRALLGVGCEALLAGGPH